VAVLAVIKRRVAVAALVEEDFMEILSVVEMAVQE
jgi:hypothetical protein